MKFNRPLTPGIIKRWDEKLLLNNPDTWSARTHLVVYYSLLFMVALTAICFIAPDDPRSRSNVPLWLTFVSLIVFVAFIIWIIYLLRFNVFKRFGNLEKLNGIKTFLLYFISIGLMVISTYIPPVVETIRANRAYTGEEIVKDINAINTKILQLERDSVPHRWDKDTFLAVNSLEERNIVYEDDTYVLDSTQVGNVLMRRIIDTAELNKKLSSTDSLQRLNDSTYVFFECPDYLFVSNYMASGHYPGLLLSSANLYRRILQHYQPLDKEKTKEELHKVLKKYDPEVIDDFKYEPDDDEVQAYTTRIEQKYQLSGVTYSMYNIAQRKYRWDGVTISVVSRVLYYITLALTLLVTVFRRTSLRTFFLTLLAAILLAIITSLIFAFFNLDDISGFVLCLFYYIAFFILAFSQSRKKVRSVFSGIGLNLTVFATTFIPLLIVGLYYAILRKKYSYEKEPPVLYDRIAEHFFYAEILGFVLLLTLMTFLFPRIYRKWHALPEQ